MKPTLKPGRIVKKRLSEDGNTVHATLRVDFELGEGARRFEGDMRAQVSIPVVDGELHITTKRRLRQAALDQVDFYFAGETDDDFNIFDDLPAPKGSLPAKPNEVAKRTNVHSLPSPFEDIDTILSRLNSESLILPDFDDEPVFLFGT